MSTMDQDILLRRSGAVYANEAAAWAALDAATHRKGQPIIAFYTHRATTHGDATIGVVFAVGTADGVGKYQACASHDDMIAVYNALNGHIQDYNTFKALFDSLFEYDEENNAIKAKLDFYSVGQVTAGGYGEDEEDTVVAALYQLVDVLANSAGDGVDGAAQGSVLSYDANINKWRAIPQSEIVPDMSQYLTATEVQELIDEVKQDVGQDTSGLSNAIKTIQGSDTNKSMREVASEELAKQLIPEGAKESLDSLQEIAAWIQSHPDDVSAMNAAIEALKKIAKTFYNNGSVTEDSIKTYIDGAVNALKTGDVANALSLINTLASRKVSAGDGLKGGGDLSADRTISHKSATELGLGTVGSGEFIASVSRDSMGHLSGATAKKFTDVIVPKSTLGTNEYAAQVTAKSGGGVQLAVVIDKIDGGTF
jgi:hypothetical protein